MKTNNSHLQKKDIQSPAFEPGRIPFLFRQNALTRITGHTLRPGGLWLTQKAMEICDFSPTDLVLDAGCGYGMTSRYLLKNHGIRSVGIDAAMHSQCVQPQFVQARLPALPFKPATFNGIFCECVLSLIPDKASCLNSFFQILKANSRLVLTDLYIPERFENYISQQDNLQTPVSCLEGAVSMLTLIKLIETAGFHIDMIEDHTRLLKELAGQMVFEHGSLNHFWEKLSGTVCDSRVSHACRTGCLKPGYCMIIAGKYE
ncbi:MAG: DVU_1556 family methyltransferase [Pseudomonadota bacterium]